MKPTDEAKRLRDEIKNIFPAWDTAVQMNDGRLDQIINKVLDFVVGAGDTLPGMLGYSSYEVTASQKAINNYQKAINKLRP